MRVDSFVGQRRGFLAVHTRIEAKSRCHGCKDMIFIRWGIVRTAAQELIGCHALNLIIGLSAVDKPQGAAKHRHMGCGREVAQGFHQFLRTQVWVCKPPGGFHV